MFIREKLINGQRYAYLVSNKWKKRMQETKQSVKKYLGKVIDLGEKEAQNVKLKGNSTNMIRLLVIANLEPYEFNFEGNKGLMEELSVDFGKWEIKIKEKKAVLRLHKGYLCDYTLRQIVRFKMKSERDLVEEEGVRLAKLIIEAGLSIPREEFVGLFEQFWKEQFTS